MIPEEKRSAVMRGLQEAFGVTGFDEISPVFGGRTDSLVLRIVVGGTPYLLKMIRRAEDPTRHYNCMRAAAEAGIAPTVWYTDVESKISITDFVNAKPLAMSQALVGLPALLRRLHALPPFARAPFNTTCTFLVSRAPAQKGPALEGFLKSFRASGLLPEADMAEFFTRYEEIAAAYWQDDGDLAASHNDLFKPDNILFDGERILLVDWEAAFLNDRYADLAVVANQVVMRDDDELVFLREYFGGEPDAYRRARFYVTQQLSHLFYTMAFLLAGSAGKPVDWSEAVPEVRDYQRRLWSGEAGLAEPAEKIAFARVNWARLLRNVRAPRYVESLRMVSAGR